MPAVETFISMASHSDGEQHQGGEGERQVTVQRIGAGERAARVPQRAQLERMSGAERRHDLEQAAARTLAELRLGHRERASRRS